MHLLNFRSLLPQAPVWAVGSRSQRSDGKCSDYEVKTVRCNVSELIPSPAARQHGKQALGHLGSVEDFLCALSLADMRKVFDSLYTIELVGKEPGRAFSRTIGQALSIAET